MLPSTKPQSIGRHAMGTLLALLLAGPATALDIYRCEDAQGAVTLTDRPCETGAVQQVLTVEVDAAVGQGLRATETVALERMERALAQRRAIRADRSLAALQARQAATLPAAAPPAPTVIVQRPQRRLLHHRPRHQTRHRPLPQRPVRTFEHRATASAAPPSARRDVRRDDLFAVPRPRSPHRTGLHGRVDF